MLKIGGMVLVLWGVATVTFFGLRLIPGDPAEAAAGGPGSQATAAELDAIRSQYGLDRPLVVQYLTYLKGLLSGDLGQSYGQHRPVTQLIGEQLANTLILTAAALVTAWVIAVAFVLIASRGGRIGAAATSSLEVVSAALPTFWLGAILIVIFSSKLRLLPAAGGGNSFDALVLPVITLAIPLAGFLGQSIRESFDIALDAPFTVSARARGEGEIGVRMIHALRHAALPGLHISGWAFGALISSAVIVETLFARPGIGRLLQNAVLVQDVPVVVGVVLLIALIYVLVNIVTDLIAEIIDPRLRSR
ncbi:ABC transporter permease [Gordonia sp. ABSL11-1]|uniref:ABC transporter permease n=1 Tax=Gordonia sp. ABSL11-1 TaxID=3053924 RepID=UPI0025743C15|nr:ABC transporter permease [Gordonia sp. ABSL11-1]MDL9948135.1 ABC transporter permease [Gordonia sp. ABSL11-1]